MTDENKRFKEENIALDISNKEFIVMKLDYENKILKSVTECDEKKKKIEELNLEVLSGNNYVKKIIKEKESVERELSSLSKSVRNYIDYNG